MAQKKETEKKDVKVRDLAPKKDAKGGALRRVQGASQSGLRPAGASQAGASQAGASQAGSSLMGGSAN